MSPKTEKLDTIGATGFAVLLGLAALCYGAWRMSFGSGGSGGQGMLPGLLYVSSERAESSADFNAFTDNGAPMQSAPALDGNSTEQPHVEADSIALAKAKQGIAESRAEIDSLNARLRAATEMKTSGAERELVPALDHVDQPTADQLENQQEEMLQKLASEHADEMAKLEAQLVASKKQTEIGSAALSKAEAEVAGLRRQVEAAIASEPIEAETKTSTIESVEETGNDTARSALASGSQELLARLDAIGDDPAKLRALYDGDPENGGARPATSVQFGVGSHNVSAAKRIELKAIADKADDRTRFLVVGYASTDGSAASNASLSNKRAEAVAREILAVVSPPDRVEVIYYGQTKRFNSKVLSPNRIVEVWPIR